MLHQRLQCPCNASMASQHRLAVCTECLCMVMYVASYIMKTDRAMGELLKRVASEASTNEKSWFSLSNYP